MGGGRSETSSGIVGREDATRSGRLRSLRRAPGGDLLAQASVALGGRRTFAAGREDCWYRLLLFQTGWPEAEEAAEEPARPERG